MPQRTFPFSDTGHSSLGSVPTSNHRSVCLSLLYGSYSNPTAATGDHLACSSARPCAHRVLNKVSVRPHTKEEGLPERERHQGAAPLSRCTAGESLGPLRALRGGCRPGSWDQGLSQDKMDVRGDQLRPTQGRCAEQGEEEREERTRCGLANVARSATFDEQVLGRDLHGARCALCVERERDGAQAAERVALALLRGGWPSPREPSASRQREREGGRGCTLL